MCCSSADVLSIRLRGVSVSLVTLELHAGAAPPSAPSRGTRARQARASPRRGLASTLLTPTFTVRWRTGPSSMSIAMRTSGKLGGCTWTRGYHRHDHGDCARSFGACRCRSNRTDPHRCPWARTTSRRGPSAARSARSDGWWPAGDAPARSCRQRCRGRCGRRSDRSRRLLPKPFGPSCPSGLSRLRCLCMRVCRHRVRAHLPVRCRCGLRSRDVDRPRSSRWSSPRRNERRRACHRPFDLVLGIPARSVSTSTGISTSLRTSYERRPGCAIVAPPSSPTRR